MDLSLLGMLSAAESGSSSSKKASGNPVQIDGLQGGVPFNEIVVSGKNFYVPKPSWISEAITFTQQDDGGIHVFGTANGNTFGMGLDDTSAVYLKPGTYTLSSNAFDTIECQIYINGKYTTSFSTGRGFEFHYYFDSPTKLQFRPRVSNNIPSGTVIDAVIYIQVESGDTATAYEPPITGRELTVGASGKNLIKYPYVETSKTQNGITFTLQSDGGIAITGQLDSGKSSAFKLIQNIRINETVCMSGGSKNIRLQLNTVDNCSFWDIGNGVSISDEDINYIRIFVTEETEPIDTVVYPQLELGDTATAYEPYHGTEYTITPDSNPYTVPVDITQYDGINVLSIADDSNPTISVNANKASEQLSTIYRTLNNKPVLLFDGNVPTSSSAGYAEFTIDKEYSALIIVPIFNDSSVYEPGACTVIPIGYITEEEQGFTAYGYPRAVQRVDRPLIKRIDNTIYVRSTSTSCNRMIIYGI